MSKEQISNILTEITHNIKYFVDIFENIIKGIIMLITKLMPVGLFLGVLVAHLNKYFVKKESYTSVIISFIGSLIAVYYITPFIEKVVTDKDLIGVTFLVIGFYINHVIKYITNQRRINKWLLSLEEFVLNYIKNKFKK